MSLVRILPRFVNHCHRCVATASKSVEFSPASPQSSAVPKKRKRRQNPSDTFGLLGSFGRGVSLFRLENTDPTASEDDGWKEKYKEPYEEKTKGLQKFELKQQKTVSLISEPVSWTKLFKKKAEKQKKALEKFEKLYNVDYEHAKVVISCARKEFNHYEGMKYPTTSIPLVSQYWAKCKYKNDWFIIKPTHRNPSFENDCCWEQLMDNLDHNVVQNAISLGYLKPTTIQVQAILAFAGKKHLFIAAETGSGKTAACAIPFLSQISKQRECGAKGKVLVLVLSKELMIQTTRMVEALARGTGIKVYDGQIELMEMEAENRQDNFYPNNWDVLISTPGLARKILSQIDTSFIETVLIDEADMLLDDSFVDVLSDLFGFVKLRDSKTNAGGDGGARVVFSSASFPEKLYEILDSVVDVASLYHVRTVRLHKLLSHVSQKFIRVREMDKEELLVNLLKKPNRKGQTLVFCKDRLTRNFVSTRLVANGISNFVLGKDESREEVFAEIAESDSGVIVATDLGGRGLDFPNLAHVINYNFPRNIVDYIHRVGRVGRVSSKFNSRVTSFVRCSWEVDLVNSIELAARLNKPINGVEADFFHALSGDDL